MFWLVIIWNLFLLILYCFSLWGLSFGLALYWLRWTIHLQLDIDEKWFYILNIIGMISTICGVIVTFQVTGRMWNMNSFWVAFCSAGAVGLAIVVIVSGVILIRSILIDDRNRKTGLIRLSCWAVVTLLFMSIFTMGGQKLYRAKKIRDYAIMLSNSRQDALKDMEAYAASLKDAKAFMDAVHTMKDAMQAKKDLKNRTIWVPKK